MQDFQGAQGYVYILRNLALTVRLTDIAGKLVCQELQQPASPRTPHAVNPKA